MDIESVMTTVVASGVGAFVAASLSFRYAMSKFRKERAFDRRLEWYERTVQKLTATYNALIYAQAGDMVNVGAERRAAAWSDAWAALLALRGLDAEAELFATPRSHEVLRVAMQDVSSISQIVLERDEEGHGEVSNRLMEITAKLVRHATATLAADVREHLELEPIMREWTIYDHEIRDLTDELAELREKGLLAGDEDE